MQQHLNEEQLVLHHYGDDGAPAWAAQHLAACAACDGEYESLRCVLALVDELPIPERNAGYGDEVWSRLRWKLGRERRAVNWPVLFAAAATLAIAFLGGAWWHAHNAAPALTTQTAQTHLATSTIAPASNAQQSSAARPNDRFLVYVVSDHLDSTERVLLEIANAQPGKPLDMSARTQRAGELVASNRMYRQTAAQRGDQKLAAVLADIEPVLVELSHAGNHMSAAELASLQKRIDSKGLLFQVRVISAQASEPATPPPTPAPGTSSL